jgi:hypothetical protein
VAWLDHTPLPPEIGYVDALFAEPLVGYVVVDLACITIETRSKVSEYLKANFRACASNRSELAFGAGNTCIFFGDYWGERFPFLFETCMSFRGDLSSNALFSKQ